MKTILVSDVVYQEVKRTAYKMNLDESDFIKRAIVALMYLQEEVEKGSVIIVRQKNNEEKELVI